MRLSSVAEELAAWAIIEEAKHLFWYTHDAPPSLDEGEDALCDGLIDMLVEDTDFKHLFTPSHDGIDEPPLGTIRGMSSRAFKEWFTPFVADEDVDATYPTVHPYGMTPVETEASDTKGDDHDVEE